MIAAAVVFVAGGSIAYANGGGASMDRAEPELNQRTVRHMALAWIATLPGAALLGVAAYAVAQMAGT